MIRETIKKLSDEERLQLFHEALQYELTGSIDKKLMKRLADEFNAPQISLVANGIITEIYRYFAIYGHKKPIYRI